MRPRTRAPRRPLLATALLLLVVAGAPVSGGAPDELLLEIPELAVQTLLDRASPLRGSTPEGIEYAISNPQVRIREGRILTTMDINLSGSLSILGAELAIDLDGSVEGEIVARINASRRTVEGGLEITRLSIDNLEKISDADDLKAFLSSHLTHFSYPIDVPMTEIPELSILLGGTITGLDVEGNRVVLRARLKGSPAR